MSLDVTLHEGSPEGSELFSSNITHNLGKMAGEAGLYEALWRPDEQGWTRAADLIPHLRAGLSTLLADKERLLPFEASNGWGRHKNFVPFVAGYLRACEESPDAFVTVSR